MTPHVALAAVRTFDDVVTTATRTSGLLSWLSVLFGGLAVVLAVVGVYGLMSYSVAQRERELAVRAAVGASRGSLLGLIVTEGLRLSAAGIAARCKGLSSKVMPSPAVRSSASRHSIRRERVESSARPNAHERPRSAASTASRSAAHRTGAFLKVERIPSIPSR